MLSILVLEDLAMAVYLPILAALLVGGSALATMGSVVIAVGAAGAALVLALRYGEHVSRLVAHRSDEVVLLVVLGLVLVVAGAAAGAAGVGRGRRLPGRRRAVRARSPRTPGAC